MCDVKIAKRKKMFTGTNEQIRTIKQDRQTFSLSKRMYPEIYKKKKNIQVLFLYDEAKHFFHVENF